jgi:hypothetical protein
VLLEVLSEPATAEMLLQRHRALGEHYFEQVIDGAFRRHQRPIGLYLVAEEAADEAADLLLLESHAFGGNLLVVAVILLSFKVPSYSAETSRQWQTRVLVWS